MTDDEQRRIFSRNLNYQLSKLNITQKDVADKIGVSPQTFNTWSKGVAIPRMGKVQRLADYFGINKSDLIDDKSPSTSSASEAVRINVLGRIPAGVPIEAVEDIVDWEDIPLEWTKGGKEFFGLRVVGDSMFPKYIEEDTIIVRKCDDCESGDDCVVYVNGCDATLKKVVKKTDCIILQPLNPVYEPKVYDYNDEECKITIAGVVIEIRRKV